MDDLEKIKTHVTKEEEIYAEPERAALFTDDISEKAIKPEISKQSTVAFTEKEGMK